MGRLPCKQAVHNVYCHKTLQYFRNFFTNIVLLVIDIQSTCLCFKTSTTKLTKLQKILQYRFLSFTFLFIFHHHKIPFAKNIATFLQITIRYKEYWAYRHFPYFIFPHPVKIFLSVLHFRFGCIPTMCRDHTAVLLLLFGSNYLSSLCFYQSSKCTWKIIRPKPIQQNYLKSKILCSTRRNFSNFT